MEQIPDNPVFKTTRHIEARIFRQRYLLLFNWHLKTKDYAKGAQLLPALAQELNRFEKSLEPQYKMTFQYLAAYILFLGSNFHDALNWLEPILANRKPAVQEIAFYSRVLNLFIHLELGNVNLLENLIPNSRRFIRSRRKLEPIEKLVFSFLQKQLSATNKNEAQQLREKLAHDIVQLKSKTPNIRLLEYLDLEAWLNQ